GHRSSECNAIVKCAKCGNDRHPTALLKEKPGTTHNLFQSTPGNNLVSMSQEDKRFLKIMETGTRKNQQGNWE
ncbi:unnamed protein product, partial [Porites evermanni]